MTEAVALVCACALVVPALVIFTVLEVTTPSPVYWDFNGCRFRRKSDVPDVGAKSWARTVAEAHDDDEAALALVIQQSMDEQSGSVMMKELGGKTE